MRIDENLRFVENNWFLSSFLVIKTDQALQNKEIWKLRDRSSIIQLAPENASASIHPLSPREFASK